MFKPGLSLLTTLATIGAMPLASNLPAPDFGYTMPFSAAPSSPSRQRSRSTRCKRARAKQKMAAASRRANRSRK